MNPKADKSENWLGRISPLFTSTHRYSVDNTLDVELSRAYHLIEKKENAR
jgi:hypothetical protein